MFRVCKRVQSQHLPCGTVKFGTRLCGGRHITTIINNQETEIREIWTTYVSFEGMLKDSDSLKLKAGESLKLKAGEDHGVVNPLKWRARMNAASLVREVI